MHSDHFSNYGSRHLKEQTEVSSSASNSDQLVTFKERLLDSKEYCLGRFFQMFSQGDFFSPELRNEFKFKDSPKQFSYDLSENFYDIRNFLRGFNLDDINFQKFFIKVVELIVEIKSSDVSLSVESKLYEKVDELFNILVANGFDGSNSKTLSFWSGKDAVSIYMADRGKWNSELIDVQIPAYIALFILGNLLDDDEYSLNSPFVLFRRLVCLHIANQAKGNVSVYLSKDGVLSEDFLRVGNHFWEFELPVLRALQLKGEVKAINLIFLTTLENNYWTDPIEIDSEEANKLKLVHIIPIESEVIVKRKKRKKADYKPVVTGNEITLGKLREIIGHWRKIAKLVL